MNIMLTDCINCQAVNCEWCSPLNISSKPLEISTEDTSKIFNFLDKRFGKICFAKSQSVSNGLRHGFLVYVYPAIIRAFKSSDKSFFRIFVPVNKLSQKEIIEVFNGILENGYALRFFNDRDKLEIKSLEELMIMMELER